MEFSEENYKKLENENAELKKKLEAKEAEVSSAENVIQGLKQQLAEKTAEAEASSGEVIVKHKSESFRVVFPVFKFQGTDYKATELKNHPKVIEQLLKRQTGALIKVEPKTE